MENPTKAVGQLQTAGRVSFIPPLTRFRPETTASAGLSSCRKQALACSIDDEEVIPGGRAEWVRDFVTAG
jgi:hypothetical protein